MLSKLFFAILFLPLVLFGFAGAVCLLSSPGTPLYFISLCYLLSVGVIGFVSSVAYIWAYMWTLRDIRMAAHWQTVATGEFECMTDGRKPFVRLRDGRMFPILYQHNPLDLEPGDKVVVLLGHCKRHRIERA